MAFVLPTFNITVNIWRATLVDYTIPDVVSIANLSVGRRIKQSWFGGPPIGGGMCLLLPPLTDIRWAYNFVNPDFVEAPAGSQRFYQVSYVDDFGKGFSNEHRFADLLYQPNGLIFVVQGLIPAPVPLP